MADNLSFVLRGVGDVVYEQRPIPESKLALANDFFSQHSLGPITVLIDSF